MNSDISCPLFDSIEVTSTKGQRGRERDANDPHALCSFVYNNQRITVQKLILGIVSVFPFPRTRPVSHSNELFSSFDRGSSLITHVGLRMSTRRRRRRRVVVLRGLKSILSEIFRWIGIKNSIILKESNVTVGFDRRHICGQRRVSLRLVGFLHLPAGTFATFIGR